MQIIGRFRAEWRLKLALVIGLNLIFWAIYQPLARTALLPLREVPLTPLDAFVADHPEFWAWIYVSQFLLTSWIPLLLASRGDIRRYVVSICIMCVPSFLCFILLPVKSPRSLPAADSDMLQFIRLVDGPLNSMPSLHAAFAVCVTLLARRMFAPRIFLGVCTWVAAILISTIATGQHYVLDLVAGAVLGWLADVIAWRQVRLPATMRCSQASISHEGER